MDLTSLEPLVAESTPSMIADRIRRAIIDGRFPKGTQLAEVAIAGHLSVSRGPVREALQRLIQEGLLREERHRGVFVVELGPDDVADIYLARAAAEHAAIRIVVRRGADEVTRALDAVVEEMRRAAETHEWEVLADRDLRFHEVLVESTRSKRLMRMFRTLLAETRMCLAGLESRYAEWQDLVDEHAAIVDAIRRGDEAGALAAIDSHFATAVGDLRAAGNGTDPLAS
jgi:DNA-binding GntR family transcriptional regulator